MRWERRWTCCRRGVLRWCRRQHHWGRPSTDDVHPCPQQLLYPTIRWPRLSCSTSPGSHWESMAGKELSLLLWKISISRSGSSGHLAVGWKCGWSVSPRLPSRLHPTSSRSKLECWHGIRRFRGIDEVSSSLYRLSILISRLSPSSHPRWSTIYRYRPDIVYRCCPRDSSQIGPAWDGNLFISRDRTRPLDSADPQLLKTIVCDYRLIDCCRYHL